MSNADLIRQTALETIRIEQQSIQGLEQYIHDDFVRTVEAILHCKGRLVVSGIGKSALIAQKIVATLNSTGTPALFLHAADAIHGDLGMVQPDDIVLLISKSGESPEIKVLVPFIKQFGNLLIALCGQMQSYLATEADFVLNSTVQQEACPNNLAPTSSTTAQLVLGDALAVCLLQLRGFTTNDFARYHPGGALGKKLYLRVAELAERHERPQVLTTDGIRSIIPEITGKRLGACAVLDTSGRICGIITDGDIRRMLENHSQLNGITAADIMNPHPKTIASDELAVNAMDKMKTHQISQLIVTQQDTYFGMVHLHDLMQEGLL